MPNITSVGITAGLGTSGTGTISTLDNLVGVAGTPSAQVQTVQGVTSMTALKVDGSAVTQPVSLASTTITGTAAVTQSGTWTVQPGNTANTTAWKVDGSAVTQPVSLSTVAVTNTGTFATQSTLAAETTKAIGVVRVSDGSGNLLTSTGNAIDVNVKSGGNANGAAVAASSAPVTLPTDAAAISLAVNPVVTAASTYGAGNEVGGLMTFTGAGRTPNSSGVVQDVTLLSKTVQTGEFDLYLFNSNPTASTWADKTAPAITGADKLALIGVVKLTKNYSGLGTHTIYKPDETTFAPIPFSGANLYGVLVSPGVPSAQFGTTSDLSVIIGVI